MNIDYTQSGTPDGYACANCGRTGIKLWRQYQTVAPRLLCAICASIDQGITHRGAEHKLDFDADGKRTIWRTGERTDQIVSYVPAVPDEEGEGYWGYTSVPDAGVAWWRRLSTF